MDRVFYRHKSYVAKRAGKSMAVIGPVNSDTDLNRVNKVYKGLRELDGVGDKLVTNASETIDEVLYGEYGVWKGSDQS